MTTYICECVCVCVCTNVYNHTDTYICTSIHISQIYMFNLLFLGHARWFGQIEILMVFLPVLLSEAHDIQSGHH